jgi:HlyD family secretion protein
MMRRLLPVLLVLLVCGAFVWTLVFLYQKSQQAPLVFATKQASARDIVEKTVAAGAIVPRREVTIKARVSGVVEKLYVQPGQYLRSGDQIAKIKIIPNVVNLNAAEARLSAAEISVKNAEGEHARIKKLFDQQLLTQTEFTRIDLEYKLAKQELVAARNNLQLVKEGAIRGSGKVSNLVQSTVEGMVLEVPVEEGASVIETNNFNEGTTIASVADMNDMIFQGTVDESEVGKLREGMPVVISIGAIDGKRFAGALEYISPKGVAKEGTTEFEVRAKLGLEPGTFIRANYSANADVILNKRNQVLSISESLIQFDKGKPYVEVEVAPHTFDKRGLKLGLSDGIYVEVLEGLDEKAKVKVYQNAENGHPRE